MLVILRHSNFSKRLSLNGSQLQVEAKARWTFHTSSYSGYCKQDASVAPPLRQTFSGFAVL
ncbi:hypothetical protein PISMIDRAFT_681628 [Pisolithus microcarpus 441]|uniref:Uncharacterized protein n=1 Tax=Pisolithus microcarpus 441 TaxID=765257 RepID=A0A0C9Z4K4_9AGAM|nr:hypothetical protein PISMIDRAFT_681628 [Pisolithus microcarpus 441]